METNQTIDYLSKLMSSKSGLAGLECKLTKVLFEMEKSLTKTLFSKFSIFSS